MSQEDFMIKDEVRSQLIEPVLSKCFIENYIVGRIYAPHR